MENPAGGLAVNSFVSKISPTVSNKCPFCQEPETVFHDFLDYKRLEVLLETLKTSFLNCNKSWSETAFIFGAGYKKVKKRQLLNFIVGQTKLYIYKRTNPEGNVSGKGLLSMFVSLLKARARVAFRFYSLMKHVDEFVSQWCFTILFCC